MENIFSETIKEITYQIKYTVEGGNPKTTFTVWVDNDEPFIFVQMLAPGGITMIEGDDLMMEPRSTIVRKIQDRYFLS